LTRQPLLLSQKQLSPQTPLSSGVIGPKDWEPDLLDCVLMGK